MVYIILFTISFVTLLFLVIFRARKMANQQFIPLQGETEWFRMNLARTKVQVDHVVRLQTRFYMRGFLRVALHWYQNIVKKIRNVVRRLIQKLLRHYHPENDPKPPQPRSQFLDDIESHKKSVNEQGINNSIHEDFLDESSEEE